MQQEGQGQKSPAIWIGGSWPTSMAASPDENRYPSIAKEICHVVTWVTSGELFVHEASRVGEPFLELVR